MLSDSLQAKTDFLLCVVCQIALGTFVNSQLPESYAKFLEAINQCAELDDDDFPRVSRWLHQYITAEFVGEAK